jgi:hypothetical protein
MPPYPRRIMNMAFQPKVDYVQLQLALIKKGYQVDDLWGGGCNVYKDGKQLATIGPREGAFRNWVAGIGICDKEADAVFEGLLGLEYYQLRIDNTDPD